jgi:flagellar biosynthesis protein FlhA
MSLVQRVLQNLLRERVSVRDGVTILEALAEGGTSTKNITLLTEFVRQSLARSIVKPYLDAKGDLPALLVDSSIEQVIQNSVEHSESASRIALSPAQLRDTLERVKKAVGSIQGPTVVIASGTVRPFLRQILESELPLVAVISHAELPPNIRVQSMGIVK